jgi:hypothetical protein
VARRLFAGRDKEGTSLVTLSDADGKPRLRLQVDKAGTASSFLRPTRQSDANNQALGNEVSSPINREA